MEPIERHKVEKRNGPYLAKTGNSALELLPLSCASMNFGLLAAAGGSFAGSVAVAIVDDELLWERQDKKSPHSNEVLEPTGFLVVRKGLFDCVLLLLKMRSQLNAIIAFSLGTPGAEMLQRLFVEELVFMGGVTGVADY